MAQEPRRTSRSSQQRERTSSRVAKRSSGVGFMLFYVVFVIGISALLACVGWMAANDILALNKPEKTITITITEQDSFGTVASRLKEEGMIESKLLFNLFASFTGAKYSVEYQSDVFNDSYTGYTPYTWKTTEFAIDLWMESMPGIAYPGYIGFPTRYPL